MSFKMEFPDEESDVIVETGLMARTVRRTMAVHKGSALVVWSGPSHNGKTETAKWMVRKIDESYPTDSRAFRAKHYEVGGVARFSRHELKQGIRSLYHATIGKLSDTVYRQSPPEDLATHLVFGLRTKNIQMVLVDEAGLLSLDAIRGMVLVRDVAANENWRLTLVFIGMDDLPKKMSQLPQIKNRIHEWCYFEPYSIEETATLLAALHPYFTSLDVNGAIDREQIEFIYEISGGLPGRVVPFLRRLINRQVETGVPIDLTLLQATHLMTQRDEQRSIADSDDGYGSIRGSHNPKVIRMRPRGKKSSGVE